MKFNAALQSYIRAKKIYLSLGVNVGEGQILLNLGEVYTVLCEYQSALNSLNDAKIVFSKLNNLSELSDVLFSLFKIYFKIGAIQLMKVTLDDFEKNFNKIKPSDENKIRIEYIKQIHSFIKSRSVSVEEIKIISEHFLKQNDNHNFFESFFLTIKYYLGLSRYAEAIDELFKPYVIELCSQNSILEAQREYFLGIISKNINSDKLLSPLVYFEKAYDLIKDEYINELTWKVLFEISELYIERGNLTKAKYFVTYSRELIYFIAEKIESPHLRAAYLRNGERMNTLKKLESFYPSK
jgi:tetratricopeptide (TPR) repeat protein